MPCFFSRTKVREPAYGEKIVGFIEREAVFSVETFAGQDFCGYWLEASVVYLQSVKFQVHLQITIPLLRSQARLQGRFTNVAAPQKSRNNKLI